MRIGSTIHLRVSVSCSLCVCVQVGEGTGRSPPISHAFTCYWEGRELERGSGRRVFLTMTIAFLYLMYMSQIILKTDSTILVDALQSHSYDFSASGVLFREAKFLMSMNFFSSRCCSCATLNNRCAHELGRIGLNWDPDRSLVWIDPLPEFVQSLVSHYVNVPPQI
jgi:hypothetical protein